jgi:hypothetical protein
VLKTILLVLYISLCLILSGWTYCVGTLSIVPSIVRWIIACSFIMLCAAGGLSFFKWLGWNWLIIQWQNLNIQMALYGFLISFIIVASCVLMLEGTSKKRDEDKNYRGLTLASFINSLYPFILLLLIKHFVF